MELMHVAQLNLDPGRQQDTILFIYLVLDYSINSVLRIWVWAQEKGCSLAEGLNSWHLKMITLQFRESTLKLNLNQITLQLIKINVFYNFP